MECGNVVWPMLHTDIKSRGVTTLNVPRAVHPCVHPCVQERSYALVAFISQVINSVVVLLLVNAKPSDKDKNRAP